MKISMINLQLDVHYTIGDLVMVYYPMKDDSGKLKKLSRPWHGPYQIVSASLPVTKVYFYYGELSTQT